MAAARASSLGDRLKRIRARNPVSTPQALAEAPDVPSLEAPSLEAHPTEGVRKERLHGAAAGAFYLAPGWKLRAPLVAQRTISMEIPLEKLPSQMDALLMRWCWRKEGAKAKTFDNVDISRLLFFDLETTGLSCGAGTVAFLAAFGRIQRATPNGLSPSASHPLHVLSITQYLLLDYDGEPAFLEAIKRAFEGNLVESEPLLPQQGSETDSLASPIVISFNGKAYDSQLIRTRFVMNALPPPRYQELDLLYPARRLFRSQLASCALVELERSLLGIERVDDLPGALAPAAWLSFLKNGEHEALMRVVEHNAGDLIGLASLSCLLNDAFCAPLGFAARFPMATAGLASIFLDLEEKDMLSLEHPQGSGRYLLELAAKDHLPSRFLLARRLRKEGKRSQSREHFVLLCEDPAFDSLSGGMQARALRACAILARLDNDGIAALSYTRAELSLPRLSDADRLRARRRLERFEMLYKT